MKRRNADCGKIRRQIKRNKITEGMYGSTTILYLKFLILWAIVITADFMFMFRFEFLWPFWLLLRSVHDSFKYKGLAFSVLFVCIAITSDLVCLFFIPVHWLLFAASTYVWVQYVWHTDKGICLPTIILWMLFIYLEAGIRWKDTRHMPHLDLCRPFAAHCIGYPVVTLGFGFKSYVGYRMRQRKQREVAKENEFYMQLLQQALPQDDTTLTTSINNLLSNNNSSVINSNNDDILTQNNCHINGQLSNGSITQSLQNNLDHHTNNSSNNSSSNNNNNNNNSSINSNNSNTNNIPVTQDDLQLNCNHHMYHTSQNLNISSTSSSSSVSTLSLSAAAAAATTAGATTTTTANHHHHQHTNNLNNVNNISSSNKNAQTSSKLNHNNISTNHNSATATTILTQQTAQANGHVVGNNINFANFTGSTKNRRNNNNNNNNVNHINNDNCNNNNNDKNSKYETKITTTTTSSSTTGSNHNNNNSSTNYHEISVNNNGTVYKNSKETNWDGINMNVNDNIPTSSSTIPISSVTNMSNKDKTFSNNNHHHHHNHNNNYVGNQQSINYHNGDNNKKSHSNGNVLQYEVEEVIEPTEKVKGRRNRSKRDTFKDNHHNNINNSSHHNNNNNNHHHNSHHHSKDSHGSSDTSSIQSSSTNATTPSSISLSSTMTTASSTISNIASQIVTKICDTCYRLENEVKKYRTEISHMKQIENELRQKLDSNITAKSCLQAKQRECDELDKKLSDLMNTRQIESMNMQAIERRLNEERRQRQSLEAQLNNEKKARKLAEDKAASRPECSEQCKQRKIQIENELIQLRRELQILDDAKQNAEQQARKMEQELHMMEAELRNRDAQQGTEVLMSALAAMQEKHNTLEKNLSEETRIKMDLFSALGEAKRQLEIKNSVTRNKEEEVLDLRAKIAQLLAVMPTDSLCLTQCPTTGSSMLRINDTPPLQGPSSPMLTSLNTAHQQIIAANQVFRLTGSEIFQKDCDKSNSSDGSVVISNQLKKSSINMNAVNNQINNQINNNNNNNMNGIVVGGGCQNVSGNSSNLDPNATAYTPKNSSICGGQTDA